MTREESYIQQVLDRVPPGELRRHIEADLRAHIAERIERGGSVDEAIAQLGDPAALALSYLAAVPLVRAPFGRRIVAKAIDVLLLFILPVCLFVFSLRFLMPQVVGPEPLQNPDVLRLVITGVLTVLASSVYVVIAETVSGQTIGKRLMDLQVVTEAGGRIHLGQAFIRQLPVVLEIWAVDALFALFNEKRQRGFDMIAKTRVVDVREARRGSPARVQGALA